MTDIDNQDIEYMNDDFFSSSIDEQEIMDISNMVENQENTTSTESTDFNQHLLLSYLITEPHLWITCSPLLKEEYFDPIYKPVVSQIFSHLKDYKELPDRMIIKAETGVSLDDLTGQLNSEGRKKWVIDSVEEFCRSQAYYAHLVHAAEITQKDKSRETMAHLLKEVQRINQMSLTVNLGHEVHESAASLLEENKEDENIPTGIPYLDMALSGGVSRPSFNIVSAASGDGKSIFMGNMTVYAAEKGDNAIYYSLELQPNIIM